MKKRLDYKSKKFVITAVLIAIIAAVAIVGTVAFIKSNNNIQAIIEETTDNQNNINDNQNNINENQNKVDDSTKDNNVVSNTSTINVNNFETLKETTIIEYKDVEKVSKKSKTIGWKPNAFELNIENIIGVNKTRKAILIGAGNLGMALMSYRGFENYGIKIVAAFDSNNDITDGKQIFKCFGCGKGGNVVNFIMLAENLSYVEALGFLADRAGIVLDKYEWQKRSR